MLNIHELLLEQFKSFPHDRVRNAIEGFVWDETEALNRKYRRSCIVWGSSPDMYLDYLDEFYAPDIVPWVVIAAHLIGSNVAEGVLVTALDGIVIGALTDPNTQHLVTDCSIDGSYQEALEGGLAERGLYEVRYKFTQEHLPYCEQREDIEGYLESRHKPKAEERKKIILESKTLSLPHMDKLHRLLSQDIPEISEEGK
ncbi:MAG TPA: hypothetical protein VJH95_05930 [Candidatus Nanoarchaeia archaeon]|nr:hypothetical protein [Candidatus Nanoarchaeia archaeon]